MRFIATGDNHFHEGPRFAECLRIHDVIAQQVEREKPDAVFIGGDIYDAASTPLERATVAAWVTRLAEVCPVLITKGNHDRPLDCALLARLRAHHKITVEEACGVHLIGGAAVAAVAWPSLGNLAAMLNRPVTSGTLDDVARDELRAVFRGLGAELDKYPDLPRLALGHFMIDGSVTGEGQPLIGAQLNVSLSDLGLMRSSMVLCSHIHAPQEWTYNGKPIAFMGSPYRTNFGEREMKSIILGDVTLKGCAWERLPLPATPMVHLQAEFATGDDVEDAWRMAFNPHDAADVLGAEVRFRYTVPVDRRDAARRAMDEVRVALFEAGALTVKTEEMVLPAVRARAPEIALAKTLPEKLDAVFRAKNITVSEERRARIMVKLSEVQGD